MIRVSVLADTLIGSEIIKLNQDIKRMIDQGNKIINLTIGDYDPNIFPLPAHLRDLIKLSYDHGQTNYPPADGVFSLKASIGFFLNQHMQRHIHEDEILVAGGGRPLIYAIYQAIVDPGDVVVYPTPSWNNNHYCHLVRADGIAVPTYPEYGFMPRAQDLEPYLQNAVLLPLCSPQNPTGTMFTAEQLQEIVDLVLKVNASRSESDKPLYVLYDQIYAQLHRQDLKHVDPVALDPRMQPYVIYVDGISKFLSATGVRVGWSVGPKDVIDKMKSILGHIGAWAPKPEQVACSRYLVSSVITDDVAAINAAASEKLYALYRLFMDLKEQGYPVDAIEPQGGMYVSVRFPILDQASKDGLVLRTSSDLASYLLEHGGIGIVPFTAFGADHTPDWFRVSIGTLKESDVASLQESLQKVLSPFLR